MCFVLTRESDGIHIRKGIHEWDGALHLVDGGAQNDCIDAFLCVHSENDADECKAKYFEAQDASVKEAAANQREINAHHSK